MSTQQGPGVKSHEEHVSSQFGARAASYVSSTAHASGGDLAQIAELAKTRKPARALDLGCGGGHVTFHVAPHSGHVTAYDLSSEMLAAVAKEAAARALTNVVTHQGSVEQLPFKAGAYDFVASRYSAHHWHNLRAGLKEARRVLAPGGVAVFADTVSSVDPLIDTHLQAIELLRDPSHVRNYAVDEWLIALTAAGFKPGNPTLRRLRLDFAAWIARMATPPVYVDAIRALHAVLPRPVADYLALESDGSFTIDSMTVEASL
jgi:ubiquinone/menaquinone biosynthesis C-methylase UbiE